MADIAQRGNRLTRTGESVKKTPRIKKYYGGIAKNPGFKRGTRKANETFIEKVGGSAEGKPHSTKEGRIASGKRKITRFLRSKKKPSPPKSITKDLLMRYPKVPQPHKSPGDTPYIPRPKYTPGGQVFFGLRARDRKNLFILRFPEAILPSFVE